MSVESGIFDEHSVHSRDIPVKSAGSAFYLLMLAEQRNDQEFVGRRRESMTIDCKHAHGVGSAQKSGSSQALSDGDGAL
jgi:hypothetical protein